MNEYVEAMIGFDARENVSKFTETWDSERTQQYLLKTDIVKPLSVDVMVWDSIFHLLNFELPAWIGPRQQWDNLQRLHRFIEEKKINDSYSLVAITQWTINEKDSLEKPHSVEPELVSNEWTLLGFDIADHYLLSGLMNAGYEVEERKHFSLKWSKYLNQYHLFDDLELAIEFKSLTDKRVEEHNPFSVYGIYLIEKVDEIG